MAKTLQDESLEKIQTIGINNDDKEKFFQLNFVIEYSTNIMEIFSEMSKHTTNKDGKQAKTDKQLSSGD